MNYGSNMKNTVSNRPLIVRTILVEIPLIQLGLVRQKMCN